MDAAEQGRANLRESQPLVEAGGRGNVLAIDAAARNRSGSRCGEVSSLLARLTIGGFVNQSRDARIAVLICCPTMEVQ